MRCYVVLRGGVGCILCQKRLMLSLKVEECKPLVRGGVHEGGEVLSAVRGGHAGRGLHSSTFQPNLSRFGHTSPCPPV